MTPLVPRFASHAKTSAVLTPDSWQAIFSNVRAEKGSKNNWHCWRKVATVRIGQHDAIYVNHGDLRGLYHNPKFFYRRVYGVVLFHTQSDTDERVELIDKMQLRVGMGMTFSGSITTVTMYLTDRTRFSERTYHKDEAIPNNFLYGAYLPATATDLQYGLLRSRKMYEWNYCPPPLKIED